MTRDQLLDVLHAAFSHLHDADYLRQCPLAPVYGVANRFDTASRLRTILINAVLQLKPPDDQPYPSPAWRTYIALHHCFVQRLSQDAVADQLGVSTRQLRRLQHAALEIIADQLWQQYHAGEPGAASAPADNNASGAVGGSSLPDELAWLKDAPLDKAASLTYVLDEVIETSRPLAQLRQVSLNVVAPATTPSIAAHPLALGQCLLSLVTAATGQCGGGSVSLSVQPQDWTVDVDIRGCSAVVADPATRLASTRALAAAERLAEVFAGAITVSWPAPADPTFVARLTAPIAGSASVIVLDDNADMHKLLTRFTSGTRYRLVATSSPDDVVNLAQQHGPMAIVLDVMMPDADGWRMLGRLRQHPVTQDVPIIVCTILAQQDLALSLGATEFLQKPITRRSFLDVLDHLWQATQKGSSPAPADKQATPEPSIPPDV